MDEKLSEQQSEYLTGVTGDMSNFETYFTEGQRFIRLFYLGKLENGTFAPVMIEVPLEDWVTEDQLQPYVNDANMQALKNGLPANGIVQLIQVPKDEFEAISQHEIKNGAQFIDVYKESGSRG